MPERNVRRYSQGNAEGYFYAASLVGRKEGRE